MNLSMSLLILWCFYGTTEVASHNALHLNYIFDYFTNFEDIDYPIITACPASTPKENKFNYNVSISEKSLFMRNLNVDADSVKKNQLNICENAFAPATIYDRKRKIYEIGYELYYEETRIKLVQIPVSFKYDNHVSVHFPSLRPFEKPSCDYVKKYEDDERVKFKFFDGSETLAFIWIPVLYMSVTTKTKQIDPFDWHLAIDEKYNPKSKHCDDYHHLKDKKMQYLFSEKCQEKCLKDLSTPPPLSIQNPKTSFLQHYGYLVKSFLIPPWYSSKHAYKQTYCTWMNFVPIWKTIAHGQLRKVEVFVFLLANIMRQHPQYEWEAGKIRITELSSGVSGVLKLMRKNDSETSQEIHLSDEENFYTIPVPKIIFKIIRLESMFDERGAVIIIHNNPAQTADSDRICAKESEVPGWNTIRNEDPGTGLTYACPLTPEVIQKLQPNNFITFNHSEFAFDFEGCFPREAMYVNQYMEALLRWVENLVET